MDTFLSGGATVRRLSVIIPVYNEEQSLPVLHAQLTSVLDQLPEASEIVYIDDGSEDGSFAALLTAAREDTRVRVIRFRRNFGQTAAIQAGIEHSSGDVLILMDGDLQNDPADIPMLLRKLDEGYDVVSGWRQNREDRWLSRRLPSRFANTLISAVTGVHLNDYGCTLKAYRREALESVKLYGEMHRFIPALAAWSGAAVTEVPVAHHARRYGVSKYGIGRTPRVLLDLATVKFLGSYSSNPIHVFGLAGFSLWILAVIAGIVTLAQLVAINAPAHRNPMLLLAVFLAILGAMCIMMGLLAELIIRTHPATPQDNRTYVVREVVEGGADRERTP